MSDCLCYDDVVDIIHSGTQFPDNFNVNDSVTKSRSSQWFTFRHSYINWTCSEANLPVAKALIKLGANLLTIDEKGRTTLMMICDSSWNDHDIIKIQKRHKFVEWFLQQPQIYTIIDNKSKCNVCALFYTTAGGNLDLSRSLLLHGSSITQKEIDIVHEANNEEMMQLFEKFNRLEEWRPWTHHRLPAKFRMATQTLALLAKAL